MTDSSPTQPSASSPMLSPHFARAELLTTAHTSIDNTPPLTALARLETLSADFLEAVRAKFGPIQIHSGYRSPELNRVVGGVGTSAHCYGAAADFTVAGVDNDDPVAGVTAVVRWLKNESGLSYDQVIDETAGESRWVHLGIAYPLHQTPRKQTLVYAHGIYSIFGDR